MFGIVGLITLAIIVGALVDIIVSPDWKVRHLPKMVWVMLVIFLPLIGSLVWFGVGHDWSQTASAFARAPQVGHQPGTSASAPGRSTEEQLAELDREIEYYERLARLEKAKREAGERERQSDLGS